MARHDNGSQTRRLDLAISQCVLADRYDVIKKIGDGSFGCVSLARRVGSGRHSTLVRFSVEGSDIQVAIKSMKKKIEPKENCLKLREVQVRAHHDLRLTILESV